MPQTETEILIAAIWEKILQLEKVGINDNFFDLGGHSLLMVQIHHKLEKIFSQLSMVEMFKYPTIHSLAKRLTQNLNEKSVSVPSYEQSHNRHVRRTSMNQQRQLRSQNRLLSK